MIFLFRNGWVNGIENGKGVRQQAQNESVVLCENSISTKLSISLQVSQVFKDKLNDFGLEVYELS